MNESTFTLLKILGVNPEPTARSAVPGVSPGRGLLIVHSEGQSRCSWAMGMRFFWYVMTSCSH